jgi:hypothetical protein
LANIWQSQHFLRGLRVFNFILVPNRVEDPVGRGTLNPACHPCPQYGRRAAGRPEPVNAYFKLSLDIIGSIKKKVEISGI